MESGVFFTAPHVQVLVGEDAPFSSYVTSSIALPADLEKTHPNQVGDRVIFAQPWRPMKSASEIKLMTVSKRRGKGVGSYLLEGKRRWWVSLAWDKDGLTASSTHLAQFALLRDQESPEIGSPKWDLSHPSGPRLFIPISDQLSGVSKVKLRWQGKEVPIEIQRSWSRLIFHPSISLQNGLFPYEVSVKDRSGQRTQRSGELRWPPPPSQRISKDDPIRYALEPPLPQE